MRASRRRSEPALFDAQLLRTSLLVAAAAGTLLSGAAGGHGEQSALRRALTFHASFDGKANAASAAGDPQKTRMVAQRINTVN
jgi:hypothetical protein